MSNAPPGIGFPNLLQGQVFNTGPTTNWVAPQVSAIKNWKLFWGFGGSGGAPGGWNAIVEFWATTYNPNGRTVNQPDGTELIIWLAEEPGGGAPGPGSLTGHALIEGIYWNVYAGRWPTNQNTSARWNFIAYVPATPPGPMGSNFLIGDIAPFFADAQLRTGIGTADPLGPCQDATRGNNQCLDSSWYITSAQAGFETFGGGNGLVLDDFFSSPNQVNGYVCEQPACMLAAVGM